MSSMRRAYILTEIMMSMLLHSMLIVMLASAFYMMLSFYTSTQKLQTARERGHRVITYFDQRIRHAGLGLWGCGSSGEIVELMNRGGAMKNVVNLPVSVISRDPSNGDKDYFNVKEDNNAYCNYDRDTQTFSGNIATILYAYRDFDSTKNFILKDRATVKNGWTTVGIHGDINNAGFNNSSNRSSNYAVIESTGLPLTISRVSGTQVKLQLDVPSDSSLTRNAYAGGELLHLGCERLFVAKNANLDDRSFAFAFPESGKWGNQYYHVPGILEIYMELHAPENGSKIFDLYVLSTGGKNDIKASSGRPVKWPENARWSEEYNQHVLYISRASWKLNNIPESFRFKYPEP